MRFYILPLNEGKTVCINFDHVANIAVSSSTIEIYFAGSETPMTISKSPATLAQIAKGMDLSESSKEQVNSL
ncbi:MAG: hypothetical protein LV479_02060 [Methylacidiphilales bacterium]|nr:hypothetical protein [Candidatus Methylacidiphilales bacterium]